MLLALMCMSWSLPAVSQHAPEDGPLAIMEALSGAVSVRSLAEHPVLDLAQESAVRVRFEGQKALVDDRSPEELAELRLRNGDLLRGLLLGGDGEGLFVGLLGGVRMRVGIDQLQSLLVPSRIPQAAVAPVVAAAEGDTLYRSGGLELDRIEGAVEEFGPDGVRFEGLLGLQSYAWEEVAALFVEALGELPPQLRSGPGVVAVDLNDGSRLRGKLVGIDQGQCRLSLDGGQEIGVPLGAVAEITAVDGRVLFLSELAPARVQEGSPFGDELGQTWPHRVDRSVTGKPLLAGGRRYSRGLGVHAPSELSWELDGGWAELRGSCALSDEVLMLAARGSVVFRVLVDEELRWESGVLRGGDPPAALPAVDLRGARVLTLEAAMTPDFFAGDRANWLGLLLVRGP